MKFLKNPLIQNKYHKQNILSALVSFFILIIIIITALITCTFLS